jgi:phage/plasmid-like protein (TIGR03299 family)
MSHEVKQYDTVVTADGKGTWHNVNSIAVPSIDTLDDCRLNWTVSKNPLFIEIDDENGEKKTVAVPGHFAMMRDDISLPVGVVGNQYREIQNSRVWEALGKIIEGRGKVVTAGSLFNCRQIWFLVALNEGTRTVAGHEHKAYLLFSSSHDGSLKLEGRFTDVRVVCNNTLTWAIQGANETVRIPHSASAEIKIVASEKMFDEIFTGISASDSMMTDLADIGCDSSTAYLWACGFLNASSVRGQNIARDIVHRFRGGMGNKGETRLDLLNGLTERFTHGADDVADDGEKSETSRFISSTFGGDNARKIRALSAIAVPEDFNGTVTAGRSIASAFVDSAKAKTSKALRSLSFVDEATVLN